MHILGLREFDVGSPLSGKRERALERSDPAPHLMRAPAMWKARSVIHPSPKIANYLVIRLLEARSQQKATPAELANTLLLDTITLFPHASVAEYLEGISLAKALVSWRRNDDYDRQLGIIADAIRTLGKP